jgi:hypothetical protein
LACNVADSKILPHNVHDIQEPFRFRGLGHERRNFSYVHDIHDIHPKQPLVTGFGLGCQGALPAKRDGLTALNLPKKALDLVVNMD